MAMGEDQGNGEGNGPSREKQKRARAQVLANKAKESDTGVGRSWDVGFEQQGEGKWYTEKAGRECVMRFGDSGMCIF